MPSPHAANALVGRSAVAPINTEIHTAASTRVQHRDLVLMWGTSGTMSGLSWAILQRWLCRTRQNLSWRRVRRCASAVRSEPGDPEALDAHRVAPNLVRRQCGFRA